MAKPTKSEHVYSLGCTNWEYGYQPTSKFSGFTATLESILAHAVAELDANRSLKAVIINRRTFSGYMYKSDGKGGYKREHPPKTVYAYLPIGCVSRVICAWPNAQYRQRYIWIPNEGVPKDLTPKNRISKVD